MGIGKQRNYVWIKRARQWSLEMTSNKIFRNLNFSAEFKQLL